MKGDVLLRNDVAKQFIDFAVELLEGGNNTKADIISILNEKIEELEE